MALSISKKGQQFCKKMALAGLLMLPLSLSAKTVWIDVRTPEEYQAGHVQNAENLPLQDIAKLITAKNYDKDDTILLYCRSGRRSGLAQKTLQDMGYHKAQNAGGFEALKTTGAVKVVEPKK